MKRLLSLSLIIILVFSCFSGCSSGDSKEETEGQTVCFGKTRILQLQ